LIKLFLSNSLPPRPVSLLTGRGTLPLWWRIASRGGAIDVIVIVLVFLLPAVVFVLWIVPSRVLPLSISTSSFPMLMPFMGQQDRRSGSEEQQETQSNCTKAVLAHELSPSTLASVMMPVPTTMMPSIFAQVPAGPSGMIVAVAVVGWPGVPIIAAIGVVTVPIPTVAVLVVDVSPIGVVMIDVSAVAVFVVDVAAIRVVMIDVPTPVVGVMCKDGGGEDKGRCEAHS
jgi:hypothetical protein